jgi:hypothetical protein
MAEPELYDRLLGVVLNKAKLEELERFDGYYVDHGYRNVNVRS